MTTKLAKSPHSFLRTLLASSPPNNAKAAAAAPGLKELTASKGSTCFLFAYLAVVGQRVSRDELNQRSGPPRVALQMAR
jgi:hypothetical protein